MGTVGAYQMTISVPLEILTLPVADKLDLVGKIWDSIELRDIEPTDEHLAFWISVCADTRPTQLKAGAGKR